MKNIKIVGWIVGGLFLAAMLAYGVGDGLVSSQLASAEGLGGSSVSQKTLNLGATLMLLNSVIVVAIGWLMRPVLRQFNPSIAAGYLGTRVLEGAILVFGVIALLSIGPGYDPSMVEAAVSTNFTSFQIAMIVLGLGSVPFTYLLYRTELIPRPLALVGLVGYLFLAAGAALELNGVPVGLVMSTPGGLFELGLPIWLFSKGFNLSGLKSDPNKEDVLV